MPLTPENPAPKPRLLPSLLVNKATKVIRSFGYPSTHYDFPGNRGVLIQEAFDFNIFNMLKYTAGYKKFLDIAEYEVKMCVNYSASFQGRMSTLVPRRIVRTY